MELMENRTKEEQVADFLREGVLSGRIPRGSRLKQLEISKQLGISITPVREALKILEAEGYIAGGSYRGAAVAPIDLTATTETLRLRTMLEMTLVRRAVERVRAVDLEDLRKLADEFAAAVAKDDRSEARGVNYRFHRRLYDIADLPQTLHFVQILWARYPFDLINAVPGRGNVAVFEHREIMKNLIASDVDGVTLAMRHHIESGWEAFKAVVDLTEQGGEGRLKKQSATTRK
jgi:DNA-binding GntR family transcriptional regulator